MKFTKVTLLLLILAITFLVVVESRNNGKGRQKGRYKLFKSRLNRRLPEEGRQHRDSYNSRDEQADNKRKNGANNAGDDYEDIDDELNNLDLDDSNRIFFINKGQTQTTTAAPVTTPPVDPPVDPPPPPVDPPPPPVEPPVDAPPPPGPPAPPTPPARNFHRQHRYRDYDF